MLRTLTELRVSELRRGAARRGLGVLLIEYVLCDGIDFVLLVTLH